MVTTDGHGNVAKAPVSVAVDVSVPVLDVSSVVVPVGGG